MTGKVWFITGTSKGFGRVWAEAALARGDRVAATARNVETLQPLVSQSGDLVAAIALDVTDKAAVGAAVAETIARFGRIDVAINNAGYGLFGAIEEVSEAEARAQIETNLFGALWVTQAVLPQMRAQGSGHILQVSSIGGVNAFPTVGLYHASKWGLEGSASRWRRRWRVLASRSRWSSRAASPLTGAALRLSARRRWRPTTASGRGWPSSAPVIRPAIRTRPARRS